jgi:hypothetical protein
VTGPCPRSYTIYGSTKRREYRGQMKDNLLLNMVSSIGLFVTVDYVRPYSCCRLYKISLTTNIRCIKFTIN